MPFKTPALALSDIREHIVLARAFVAGMSFETFRSDQKTMYATIRCLEVVSEATRKLPVELRDQHPSIRWHAIIAAGNTYRRGYRSVTDDGIWATVEEAAELLVVVEQELAGVDTGGRGAKPDGSS